MSKYIIQAVYHILEKENPTFGITFEESEYTVLPLGSSEEADYGYINDEVNETWEDSLRSILEDKELEYDVTYKTTFQVNVTYSKDYLGEVDADTEVIELHHTEYAEQEVADEDFAGTGAIFF